MVWIRAVWFQHKRHIPAQLWAGVLALFLSVFSTSSAETTVSSYNVVEMLINKAQLAQFKGDVPGALELLAKALELEPTNAQAFYVRGRLYTSIHDPVKAIADFDRALQIEPRGAEIYQLRGLERIKIGQFQQAIADFDQFLKFVPKQEPYHWHRGIAYYFAGRYEEGRKQFELRQSLGTNAIENAYWHFLCVARSAGIEKARASLLPMQEDNPLVMRKIYDVFAGKTRPEEVFPLAESNYTSSAQRNRQLFFAHFYLSFYYELTGDKNLARVHAQEAAEKFKPDNFMGDVAVIRAHLLQNQKAP